eukprot:7280429-Pyramimonas_sp.AAC.1
MFVGLACVANRMGFCRLALLSSRVRGRRVGRARHARARRTPGAGVNRRGRTTSTFLRSQVESAGAALSNGFGSAM